MTKDHVSHRCEGSSPLLRIESTKTVIKYGGLFTYKVGLRVMENDANELS